MQEGFIPLHAQAVKIYQPFILKSFRASYANLTEKKEPCIVYLPFMVFVIHARTQPTALELFLRVLRKVLHWMQNNILPIAVQLHMSWHFSIRHSIWRFLQFQHLEINTFTFIWHYVKWIQRAGWTASLVTEKKKWSQHSWRHRLSLFLEMDSFFFTVNLVLLLLYFYVEVQKQLAY